MLNQPSYLTFNLIWRETNPLLTDILKVFLMIPQRFRNLDLFEVMDIKLASNYELYGMICFWGAHYIAYFKSNDRDEHWIYYDDTIVSRVENWKEVIIKCMKSHFHPTILLYKKLDGKLKLLPEEEELSKEEINKWFAFCEKYDRETEATKQEEPKGRLRPTSDSKKLVNNYQSINLPKNFDEKQAELIKEMANADVIDNQLKSNTNYYQNTRQVTEERRDTDISTYVATESDVKLNPDEWICDVKCCNTVNKNETAICSGKL
jgi:hypothetical protein